MQERKLQQYLLREYPQENARCEWKEFKNLKNSFCGDDLQKKGFSASKDYYLAFDLESNNPEISFEGKAGEILQLKKSANPYKKEPYFTTLEQLLEAVNNKESTDSF